MNQIALISVDTVKQELGLTENTYDTQITNLIPRVSTDVRRILNNNYDRWYRSSYEAGDTEIFFGFEIPLGTVLQGVGIPEDTYLASYNPLIDRYTLSKAPTEDGTYVFPTINIAQWATISRMIWYRLQNTSTDSVETTRAIAATTEGPVSITYAQSEVNKRWNYPQLLIDDLGDSFLEF